MTPDAAVHFISLGYVLTPETARIHIDAARDAGATEAECAEAWATWEQMRAEDVQRIESQPTPAVQCRCSHTATYHVYGSGNCVATACGCRYLRRSAPIPARQREDYDPSPEPIDRQIR